MTPDTLDAIYVAVRRQALKAATWCGVIGLIVTLVCAAFTLYLAIFPAAFTWALVSGSLKSGFDRDFLSRVMSAFAAHNGPLTCVEYTRDRSTLGWAEATPLVNGDCITRLYGRVEANSVRFAFYEVRREARGSRGLSAQLGALVYARRRKEPGQGITVVVPKTFRISGWRKNVFSTLQRLEVADERLRAGFDVYSSHAPQSQRLLAGGQLVGELLRLGRLSRSNSVTAYFGPEIGLFAVTNPVDQKPVLSVFDNRNAALQRVCTYAQGVFDVAREVEGALP